MIKFIKNLKIISEKMSNTQGGGLIGILRNLKRKKK